MSTQYIRSTPPELLLKLWHQFFEFPILPLANHQVKQLPSLLHPLENNKEASYGLFKPVEKKVYEIDLPKARGKLLKGSSFSWIGKVEDMHSRSPTDIYLINPLTRVQIKLPPRNNFLDWYIEPTRSSRRRIRLLISPMLFMNTILRQKGTWTKISQSLMMWVYTWYGRLCYHQLLATNVWWLLFMVMPSNWLGVSVTTKNGHTYI